MNAPLIQPLRRWLSRPVDGASLAAFRIGFGLVVAYLLAVFIVPDRNGHNWIELFVTGEQTRWHFPYPYLSWLRPLPEPGTTLVFLLALAAAMGVTLGLFYRVSSVVLLVTFSFLWLMDASLYGNHYPLVVVFLVCLVFVPAAQVGSVDAWLARRGARARAPTVSWWSILLLRIQIGLVYFYGGVAKLHPDWLQGEPLRMWLGAQETVAPIERLLGPEAAAEVHHWLAQPAAAWLFSYGGLIFDLTIPLLLSWRRTRWIALVLMTGFHTFNFWFVAQVGLVAVLAFWATLVFCEPDWPRRLLRWQSSTPTATVIDEPSPPSLSGLRLTVLVGWVALQVLWPLRHFAIAGDAYWTDEGTRASWFLMTRNKTTALAQFRAVDPAIHAVPTTGGPRIDWQPWKGMRPPVELIEIDAQQVDWSKLPEVFATYEPLVGERLFFNPAAKGISTYGGAVARAGELWQRQFGRRPQLTKTRLLSELLDELGRAAVQTATRGEAEAGRYAQLLAAARARHQQQREATDPIAWRRHYRATLALLDDCHHLPRFGSIFVAGLARCAPLGLQGYTSDGVRPLLIGDPPLVARGHAVAWRLQRELWPDPLPTYCQVDRLEARYWPDLPSIVPILEPSGRVAFLWNYTHELNAHQIEALELLPPLAGPLAEHIVAWWEKTQGRRPQIYGSALIALNRRPLAQVFDTLVDIAAEPYSPWRHNRWITREPPTRATPHLP